MNLIKHIHLTIGGPGGDPTYHREAVMIKKLLEDAGVQDVVIEDKYEIREERHDDELKLFVGAKPDKVTITVQHYPWGG